MIVRVLAALRRQSWLALGAFLALALVVVPMLHLAVPEDSAFHLSTYFITLIGKIMCYAIVAVAMDLIWGYGGILSLGHGLFFALGGYAFGMYLMRQIGRDGSYQSDLPDFMVFLDWKELPVVLGRQRQLSAGRRCWSSSCRRWSPSSSATSPSARGSRASISRSSPRR